MKEEIPPRPPGEPCTCVWVKSYARMAKRAAQAERTEEYTETLSRPVDTLASVPSIIKNNLPVSLGGTVPPVERNQSLGAPEVFSTPSPSPAIEFAMNGAPNETPDSFHEKRPELVRGLVDSRAESSRISAKQQAISKHGLSLQSKPDVAARQIKKRLVKSSENKTRDLMAYREDLAVILRSLVPDYGVTENDRPLQDPSIQLCHSCKTSLAYYLYRSPVRFQPYLSECSTRTFLSLVDDAVSALLSGTEMEAINHHELQQIITAELAVAEWRIAVKLAKFHRRYDFLHLFPVKIGQFAELRVNDRVHGNEDGFVSSTAKKAWSSIGLGGSKQGAVKQAGEISSHS